MNLDAIIDFPNDATEEVEKYILRVALSPKKLMVEQYQINSLGWDSNKKTILNAHKVTLREVLLYMVVGKSKYKDSTLLERYRKETGNEAAELPERIN